MKGSNMSDNNPFAGLGDGAQSGSGPDGEQYAYPQSNEPRPAPRAPEPGPSQRPPYVQYPQQQNPQQGPQQNAQYPGYPGQGYPNQGYPNQGQGYPNQGYPGSGQGQGQVQGYSHPGQFQQPGYGQHQFGQGPYGQENPKPKSRLAAGLLGVFLGAFGAHRFYLGYSGIGAAQVVATLVSGGFAGVWGFVEGIMILCNAQPFRRDAKGIPLKD